ncbi:hypothetical protein HDE_02151 [Halotydeus destructor]|nr:hypothetical protein HDE_02151 [Halotydeus destructor]
MSILLCNYIQADAVAPSYTKRLQDLSDLFKSNHKMAPIWINNFMISSGAQGVSDIYRKSKSLGKRISAENGRPFKRENDYDIGLGSIAHPEFLDKIQRENRVLIGQQNVIKPMKTLFRSLREEGFITEHVHIGRDMFGKGKIAYPLSLNISRDVEEALKFLHMRIEEFHLSTRLWEGVFERLAQLNSGKVDFKMADNDRLDSDEQVVSSLRFHSINRLLASVLLSWTIMVLVLLTEISTHPVTCRWSSRPRLWVSLRMSNGNNGGFVKRIHNTLTLQ